MLAIVALTRLGAERGAVTLAANGIVYQLFILSALLLDGFENAAQVLNGERKGDDDRAGFTAFIRAILLRCLATANALAAVFAAFGGMITDSFAATGEVAEEARRLGPWIVALPLAGFAGFVLDGVFVGAAGRARCCCRWLARRRSMRCCCGSPGRSAMTDCGRASSPSWRCGRLFRSG